MSLYRLTRSAEQDIHDIYSWIAGVDARPSVAERVVQRLYDEIERVAEMPGTCEYLEGFEGDIRKSVLMRYTILYREESNGILVLRVKDGAQLFRPEDLD